MKVDFELSIYKEKVMNLQKELEDLKLQRGATTKRSDNQDLLEIPEALRMDSRKQSSSFERADVNKIEEYKNLTAKLRSDLKEAKRKLNEFQTVQNKEIEKNKITISELTVGISKVRKEVEVREQKINDLEAYVRDLEEELNAKKSQEEPSKLQEEDIGSPHIGISVLDYKTTDPTEEAYYKKTIQDLLTQNLVLKKELDNVKKILSINHVEEGEDQSVGSLVIHK